ncbi:MAG: tRNA pseudouridine(38-40) synthase TruA [Phycisphaerae bacterium]
MSTLRYFFASPSGHRVHALTGGEKGHLLGSDTWSAALATLCLALYDRDMDRNIFMLTAYDGTDFHGWQTQPGVRTVQEVLEQSVRRVVRHQVYIVGCGRTDSGVHAAGHVSQFVTSCELDADRLRHAIGSRLPKDVSIIAVRNAHPEFHARRSAISKLYRYRIYNASGRPVEHRVRRFAYHFWQRLDVERMQAGARHFVGEKDFTAMTATGTVRESMVRTVFRCDVERHLDEIRIDVEGTGFLYKQVRNMVGALLNVGRGLWEPDRVAEALASRDRRQSGPTAPARGLCMQWVHYPARSLTPREAPSGGAPQFDSR